MKLSILTDNRVETRGLLAEHGLSVFIEDSALRLLFDTGQTYVFRHNAKEMGIDITRVDGIVLSHGHYDHCGGLVHYPDDAPMPPVYAGKGALDGKYKTGQKRPVDIGIPWAKGGWPRINKSVVVNEKNLRIAPGAMLHTDIPCTVPFEGTPQGFLTGSIDSPAQDTMRDEQMLVLERENSIDVILGCSHPGIINCLSYAQSLYPGKRIGTVLAGMHLKAADDKRIDETIRQLKAMDIGLVIPMHCTGQNAICRMSRELGAQCRPLCTGQTIEI